MRQDYYRIFKSVFLKMQEHHELELLLLMTSQNCVHELSFIIYASFGTKIG